MAIAFQLNAAFANQLDPGTARRQIKTDQFRFSARAGLATLLASIGSLCQSSLVRRSMRANLGPGSSRRFRVRILYTMYHVFLRECFRIQIYFASFPNERAARALRLTNFRWSRVPTFTFLGTPEQTSEAQKSNPSWRQSLYPA